MSVLLVITGSPTSTGPEQALQGDGADTVRVLFVIFLIGHGAVHGVMWTLPFTSAVEDMPFNPADSWLIGRRPTVAVVLAGTAAIGFVVAAVGFAARTSWWPELLGGSAAVSIVLMLLYLSPYWIVGIALSLTLGIYAWRTATT